MAKSPKAPKKTESKERPLPYNIEAEEATIGSLMLDLDALSRVVPFLKPDDFYREKHRLLFETLFAIHQRGEPADVITIIDELERRKQLDDVGGWSAVSAMTNCVPTAINLEYYARIVERDAVLRRLAIAGENIAKLAYNDENLPLPVIKDQAEQHLSQATSHASKTTISHIGEIARQSTDLLMRIHDGTEVPALPISLPSVERMIGGWYKGEQTVLAANTSIGKSTFARHELLSQALRGYHVLYIGVEMHKQQIAPLFKATLMNIDSRQLRHGFKKHDLAIDPKTGLPLYPFRCGSKGEVERLSVEADERLAELPLHIIAAGKDPYTGRIDMPDFSLRGIRAEIRKYAEKYPLAMFAVDSLPLLHYPETRSSQERSLIIGDASYMLRELAIETDAHNLLLHQLIPAAKDMRYPTHYEYEESKKIAMNADNNLILICPAKQGERGANIRDMEINVSKGRSEMTGIVTGLRMEGATGRFSDTETRALEEQAQRYGGNGHSNGHHEFEAEDVIF